MGAIEEFSGVVAESSVLPHVLDVWNDLEVALYVQAARALAPKRDDMIDMREARKAVPYAQLKCVPRHSMTRPHQYREGVTGW
jgi:hypothetical protein